jgi:FMN phosphatase YigB (HAD superfamily)
LAVEIRAILFDLGRVLVDFDMAECEATLAARSHLDHAELMPVLWDTGWARRYERGEVTAPQFHDFLKREAGLSMEYEEFLECWTEVFDPVPILPDHMLPILADSFPMTLISNTNEAHAEYVRRNYDILRFFRNQVFSYQVGALKPDRKIFDHAIATAGFPPEQMLFIDDRQENIEAGEKLGLHTHRFESVTGLVELFGSLGVKLDEPDPGRKSDR